MDFELDDALVSLQQTARRFSDEQIAPVAAAFDASGKFPRDVLKMAWELGLSHVFIPESLGGLGLSVVGASVVVEELSRGCSGITTSILSNDLGLTPILVGGTPDQQREWLEPCTAAFKILAFALSEPGAGSDVAGLQLHAEKSGKDYVLNGTKAWITNGGEADLYTVFATLDRHSRHKGICAFVLPRETPGLSPGKKEDKMGQRASDTRVLHFDNVRVPAAQRLGAEGEGFKIIHADAAPVKSPSAPPSPCRRQRDLSPGLHPRRRRALPRDRRRRLNDRKSTTTPPRATWSAVISNGTAVLGLGNIGPEAGKPVMEGKGVLFKRFADIDVFDIEVAENEGQVLRRRRGPRAHLRRHQPRGHQGAGVLLHRGEAAGLA
jgi:hypothetical protein